MFTSVIPTIQLPGLRAARRRIVAVAVGVSGLILFTSTTAVAEDYVVQPGDSLSVIARDAGVTTTELAEVNGISDFHLIRVGQVLTIPGSTYVVQPGDSLSLIAKRNGVATAALADANGIDNVHLIRVGQELKIPGGGSATPADPAAGYQQLPSKLRDNPSRLTVIPSFERWSARYDVPTDLLMAVAYRESGWQDSVISPKGAIGVGQLMPPTADWVADALIGEELDPYNADDNIRMSARFLSWLLGYMGSENDALAAYYQGPGSVRAIGYYDDTKAYVSNVQQIRGLFRKG